MLRAALIFNRTWLDKRSRARAYTSHLVAVPAGPCRLTACLSEFLSLELNLCTFELNLGVKIVACWRGDQVTGVRRGT